MVKRSGSRRCICLLTGLACGAIGLMPSAASAHRFGHHGHGHGHRHGSALRVAAVTGSDTNPCTRSAPCKTIGHAVSIAQPGGTIDVGPGSYPETVTIDKQLRLRGRGATIDATGKVNGLVISGAGAAGSEIKGLRVAGGIGEGILVTSTSNVSLTRNIVENNDQGHDTTATPECTTVGDVPGDCGEGLHLMGVTDSRVVGNLVDHNIGGILVTDETGPSHGNLIAANVSRDNGEDCGITLPSHNGDAVAHPDQAGVYDNWVIGNVAKGNGGAGVGMFASGPGTAAYRNHVIGNALLGNGEAGIAIHAHAPDQNVSGNVIVGNRVVGNGIDPDSGSGHPTGIALFSAVVPFDVIVARNRIKDEYFGFFIAGQVTTRGLGSNRFRNVTVPVGHP
jgi:nitrous oxidase accessory protein NosD